MSENENTGSLGRKIFFLHPLAVVKNHLVSELAQEEFEVYVVTNEVKLRNVLKKNPDSIVFANISEGMKESAWDEWIKGIMTDDATSGVDVGIVTGVEDVNLRRKYTEQFKLSCGFTVLKSDLPSMLKQIMEILNAANAKGRRKYVRAVTGNETNITVNLPMNGTFVHGVIKDISTVGFSCVFDDDPKIVKNSHFPDIQLRLQIQLVKAEGIVFGTRMDGDDKIYVILFTQRTSPDVRTRIRKFIQSFLQAKMDSELK